MAVQAFYFHTVQHILAFRHKFLCGTTSENQYCREEQIVKKAVEEHVDIIGLSGLITPSLEEMVNVAKELQRAGLDIPIMIGGATTSELHVALKIAPVYAGPVVWMKDASQNALVAARLMNNQNQIEQELSKKYEHLREDYQSQQKELLSYEEAKKQKKNMFE